MTVKQAAEKLEVCVATVYNLVAAGRLRCERHGLGRGCIRITEEQLAAYRTGATPLPLPPAPPKAPQVRLKHLEL